MLASPGLRVAVPARSAWATLADGKDGRWRRIACPTTGSRNSDLSPCRRGSGLGPPKARGDLWHGPGSSLCKRQVAFGPLSLMSTGILVCCRSCWTATRSGHGTTVIAAASADSIRKWIIRSMANAPMPAQAARVSARILSSRRSGRRRSLATHGRAARDQLAPQLGKVPAQPFGTGGRRLAGSKQCPAAGPADLDRYLAAGGGQCLAVRRYGVSRSCARSGIHSSITMVASSIRVPCW